MSANQMSSFVSSFRDEGGLEILLYDVLLFDGETSNRGSLVLRPSPTWVKGLRPMAATPGNAVPEFSSC